ncbi:hypothetical protein Tsubulata_033888 [Turnera subulata]|uniref:Uncharacterized protein n=1 Tax=Turnera subulata TaxID=218843 RepID=A0A9Q0FFP1_9ROSI|nr:hypothetical protein Tsubulata_033888 [Turnera subulata]
MKKLDVKGLWVSSRTSIAPAPAEQQEKLPFLNDKYYAFHGEVLLLVLVGLFSIFLVFVALVPCLKRLRETTESEREESSAMHQNLSSFVAEKPERGSRR